MGGIDRIGDATEMTRGPMARPGKNGESHSQFEKTRMGFATLTTLGFRPTCACPPADPIPCVILDPFMGSGTTAQVAIKHRRHWVGFEANPDYVKFIDKRTNNVQVKLF
jgi:hypothetical protein